MLHIYHAIRHGRWTAGKSRKFAPAEFVDDVRAILALREEAEKPE